MRREPLGSRVAGCGPPVKAPFGKSFVTEPEALAIIDKHFDGSGASIAKTKDHTRERVVAECLFTLPDQAVDPVPKICGLDGHQDFHLWRDGQHYGVFR